MGTTVLKLTAAAEAATGVALVADPSIVVGLLFGGAVDGIGESIARVAGLALIGLGVACWPSGPVRQAQRGMVTYGATVALFLAILGVRGGAVGVLLWPAVALHVILVVLLARGARLDGADNP